jgi:hypothetical protein
MNDDVFCDVSKQFPSAFTAPASLAGTAPSYSTTNRPKRRRDPSAQKAPLRMTAGINSGDDEHTELKERYFGVKATATTLNGHGVCTTGRHSQQARAAAASLSASYVTMSPAAAHTRGRKGNWNANRELRASGWEQRIFASTIERLERMGQGCRKEKAGNSEPRTESAGAPLGGQRETKTIP